MSLLQSMMFSLGNQTTFITLDAFKANTAAAYSTSKLFSISTNCLRLRRASDNAEQDFGFIGNFIDTSGIAEFIGGSAGFLSVWYDQSGNGFDQLQTDQSKQPEILLNASNGLPAINFDGFNDTMANLANVFDSSFNKSFTNIIVANKNVDSNFGIATQTPGYFYGRGQPGGLQEFGTTGISTNGHNIIPYALYNNVNQLFEAIFTFDGTNRQVYVNNTPYMTVLSNDPSDNMNLNSNITIGSAFDGSSPWPGSIYTCIYMNTALSASNSMMVGTKFKMDFGLQVSTFLKFDGNSKTYGFGSSTGDNSYPGFSYPSQLVLSEGGPVTFSFINAGLNGASSEALLASNGPINTYSTNGFSTKLLLIFWEIIDSMIDGDTAQEAIDAQSAYMATYKALGYTIAVLTSSAGQINIFDPNAPNGHGVSTNSMEAQRIIANPLMPNYIGIYYDYVVDIGTSPLVGTLESTNNMTYWNTDKLHNNDAGYAIVASLVKPTLDMMLSS